MTTVKELEELVKSQNEIIGKQAEMLKSQGLLLEDLRERVDSQDDGDKPTLDSLLREIKLGTQKLPPTDSIPFVREDHPPEGGWLVEAKSEEFWGELCKVMFQGGLAVVAEDRPGSDFMVQQLEFDFGCKVTPIDNQGLMDALKAMSMKERPKLEIGEKLAQGV